MPKRGRTWSNGEEDALISFVKSHGAHSWKEVKQYQPLKHRTANQCQSKYRRLKLQRREEEEEEVASDTETSTTGSEGEGEETQGIEAEASGEEEGAAGTLNVPENRRNEIREYLELFGYNPNTSILQAHIPGKFGRGRSSESRALAQEAAKERYGGTTFVVVGRTHDPHIKKIIQPPVSNVGESYIGYLHKGADPEGRAPHELVPLDFTPTGIDYPESWRKKMPGGSGWLITMHVPAAFAKDKNQLMSAMRKAGKTHNCEDQWKFIQGVQPYGFKRKR